MLWNKVDQRWNDRLGKDGEGDVTWTKEQWPVPGEDPLEVRVCTRKGVALSKFCNAHEAPRTSIVLHLTCGYGNFQGLMGGSDHSASAHFLLGRCGTPYLLVPTEFTSWHATWWNSNSIGIEIDNIGDLHENGDNLVSGYSKKDVYCKKSEKDCYLEKAFNGVKYWATLTEKQYAGLGKLLKALCFKHQIPRIIPPEDLRYKAFDKTNPKVRQNYRGVCTHVNIDPARRADIGPYIDWPKVIQYAGLTEADCYNPPHSVADTWKAPQGGAPAAASDDSPAPSASNRAPAADPGNTPPQSAARPEKLPPPVIIDKHTLKVRVGSHGGRILLSVKQPGDPMPVAPDKSEAPEAKAPDKRDDFITACMNFLGAPYAAGGKDPAKGIDGANFIGIAMKRVGLFKSDDEAPTDAQHLSALWHVSSGDPASPPDDVIAGDLVWFGKGDHDNDPMQHPFVYLGGDRVIGPVPDGTASSAVQVIAIKNVQEKFAGWMHVDDLGEKSASQGHPGDAPSAGEKISAALLPVLPADQYDALKALVARAGGTWVDDKGKINLVGVKNLVDRCMISAKPDAWNDTLFAAFLDDDGHKCVLDLRASLNPGTDSNRAETWQLWEGSWKFKLGAGDSTEKALQPDGKVKGWEDLGGMGAPRPNDPSKPGDVASVQPATPKSDDKPPPDKPAPRDEVSTPPTDLTKPFVFDAAGKKTSLKFGMRMMKALLAWELKKENGERTGCVYSSNGVVQPYRPIAPVAAQEWPDVGPLMKVGPIKQVSYGGKDYDIWSAFGMQWGGTGATNCCNSQFAAIFAACADGKLRIKKSDGLLELDLVANTPKAPDLEDHPAGDPKKAVGYAEAFARAWIQASTCTLKKTDGKALFGGFDKSAPAWAMQYLGVGEAIGKWGDKACLADVRIGDSGQWMAHNWLVGDIRYEVALKVGVKVYVDQGCFARSRDPDVMKDANGGDKLTARDCDWIEQNELEFQQRVKDFLALKSIEVDGEAKDVDKVTPYAARVFSANAVSYANHGTSSGKVHTRTDDDWLEDAPMTAQSELSLGISRGFVKFESENGNWGFARWYDNAGGAEWSGAKNG
jgi:N-acetyl-anhydromuramyl-L-alanine amidase AmpD